jgi:hypothetical protein
MSRKYRPATKAGRQSPGKRSFARSCRGKVRYRDKREALDNAHKGETFGQRFRAYECECGGYHLTTQL